MKSHNYHFKTKDLLQLVGLPLAPVAVFAGLMHLGALFHILPRPRPTLDVDRTILIHQVEASRWRQNVDVLLMGDSSCLIDVHAPQLAKELGRPVLNLGTLSYLDLNAYRTLLKQFTSANPNSPKAIVLLMHPEALRRTGPEPYHARLLQALIDGDDYVNRATLRDAVSHFLGLEILRGRMIARLVPTPLTGSYRMRFGFSRDFERELSRNGGSAIDPERSSFKGNAEYRLATQLKAASEAFRSAVPAGTKLFVGITPAPAGFVGPGYEEKHRQMLAAWAEWLKADTALTELPATLPDNLFTKTTHLSEAGAQIYTLELARSLQRHRFSAENPATMGR